MTTPAPPPPDLIEVQPSEGNGGTWQRMSLRSRVVLLAAVCVAATVALVSVGAFLTVRESLYEQVDRNLHERASQAVSGPQVLEPNLRSVPAAFYAAANLRICLVSADGKSVTGPGKAPPWGSAELAVARGASSSSLRTDESSNSRVIALPAGDDLALVMSQSLDPTKNTLAQLSVVLVVIGGAGILLAAAAGTAVARPALRPVQRLTAATERVARTGDLRPIPVAGDDELARLTTSFNKMLGALAESQEQQRRLVADAGHELRTPLTSLRTNLELLIASDKPGTPRLSDEDRAEMLDDVQAQLTELSALVGDLVELAREDAPNAVHEEVEFVDIVERACSRARRRASEVDFDVRLRPWTLLGDATALERAVLNLLDNAAKWSPAGATVRVEFRQHDAGFGVLEVADAGPGIPEQDRPHVFERFYRSTEARPLRGSGLGLAIVKQVAERHGGSVRVGEAPEGGALLSMYLPGRPGEGESTEPG